MQEEEGEAYNAEQLEELRQVQQMRSFETAGKINEEEETQACENQVTINEDTINQVLTVHLQPGQSIWSWGEIIASNRPLFTNTNQDFDMTKMMDYLKFKLHPPTRLKNTEQTLAYYCIRKKNGGGKILHLSEDVYEGSFIFQPSNLLTINCAPDKFTLEPYSKLPKLSFVKLKDGPKSQSVSLTLQAGAGNIILQKTLGPEEKLYIRASSLLAMSIGVQTKRELNSVCLTGPGYVFVQSDNGKGREPASQGIMMRVFMLGFLVFFLIGLEVQV